MFNSLRKNKIFFLILIVFFAIFLLYWKYSFITPKRNLNLFKYEKIIEEININQPESLNKAEVFIIQNKNIYGTLTSMFLTKIYISNKNFNKALIQLNNSLKYTQEENLKNILKIRMAKIKIQKEENEEAINILNSIKNNDWKNIIENMKGDIFINKNNKKLAIKHWEKSVSLENSNASKEIINMKINELK